MMHIHKKENNNTKRLAYMALEETDIWIWASVLGPIQRRSGKRFKLGAKESS